MPKIEKTNHAVFRIKKSSLIDTRTFVLSENKQRHKKMTFPVTAATFSFSFNNFSYQEAIEAEKDTI
jgi:hypothetical protein